MRTMSSQRLGRDRAVVRLGGRAVGGGGRAVGRDLVGARPVGLGEPDVAGLHVHERVSARRGGHDRPGRARRARRRGAGWGESRAWRSMLPPLGAEHIRDFPSRLRAPAWPSPPPSDAAAACALWSASGRQRIVAALSSLMRASHRGARTTAPRRTGPRGGTRSARRSCRLAQRAPLPLVARARKSESAPRASSSPTRPPRRRAGLLPGAGVAAPTATAPAARSRRAELDAQRRAAQLPLGELEAGPVLGPVVDADAHARRAQRVASAAAPPPRRRRRRADRTITTCWAHAGGRRSPRSSPCAMTRPPTSRVVAPQEVARGAARAVAGGVAHPRRAKPCPSRARSPPAAPCRRASALERERLDGAGKRSPRSAAAQHGHREHCSSGRRRLVQDRSASRAPRLGSCACGPPARGLARARRGGPQLPAHACHWL